MKPRKSAFSSCIMFPFVDLCMRRDYNLRMASFLAHFSVLSLINDDEVPT